MYILEELWQGRIDPCARAIRENSNYKKILDESLILQQAFMKELTPDGKQAFEEYYDKSMQLADISEQDAFIKGIRIGAQFILDVIGVYPSQMPQIAECV